MGADLLLAACWLPRDEYNEEIYDLDDRQEGVIKQRLLAKLQEQPDRKLLHDVYAEEAEKDLSTDELVDAILVDLHAMLLAVRSGFRDVTEMYFGGDHRWVLTGGMSWGDSPTEMFDVLNRLCEASWAWEEML